MARKRRGIGAAILDMLFEVDEVRLEVTQGVFAEDMYKAFGFVDTGEDVPSHGWPEAHGIKWPQRRMVLRPGDTIPLEGLADKLRVSPDMLRFICRKGPVPSEYVAINGIALSKQ